MAPVRVLVVEDSPTVRARLCEALRADPTIDLVGQATDGKQAIELCAALRPDVITMDMVLPVMSGLAATEYIMAHHPTPILIVSASLNRGEVFRTFDALAAGAVDVLEKPLGDEPAGEWEARYLATVKLVSRIRVITRTQRSRDRAGLDDGAVSAVPVGGNGGGHAPRLVAIGASTGGPSAIVEVLQGLTPGFPLPVLFVLHINEPFAASFAEWLDGQTHLRVAYARDGDDLDAFAGRVAMAPPGSHLILDGGRLRLLDAPERHSCRPSVDVLFESVAREVGSGAVACLLTGMGRDGAAGLAAIRRAGGFTIAQDEASCVVYGMPREAALLGAASRILPLQEIGHEVARAVSASRTGAAP